MTKKRGFVLGSELLHIIFAVLAALIILAAAYYAIKRIPLI